MLCKYFVVFLFYVWTGHIGGGKCLDNFCIACCLDVCNAPAIWSWEKSISLMANYDWFKAQRATTCLRTLGQADLSNSEGWQFAAVQLGLEFSRAPGPSETAYRLTPACGVLEFSSDMEEYSWWVFFLHTVYSVYVVTPFRAQTFWQKRSYTTSSITSRHWLYSQEHACNGIRIQYIQSLISKRYPIYTQRSLDNPHV